MLDGEMSLNVRQLSGSEHVRNDALWHGKREKPPICFSERPWFPQDRFMEPCILLRRKARPLRQVKVVKVFGLVKCQVHWCGQSECREVSLNR